MDGGLDGRCLGRVYVANVAVRIAQQHSHVGVSTWGCES